MNGSFTALLDFLQRLETLSIHYDLSAPTLEARAVMVTVNVPGERWEIEFFEDGEIRAEPFVSRRGVEGPELLDELFERFSD